MSPSSRSSNMACAQTSSAAPVDTTLSTIAAAQTTSLSKSLHQSPALPLRPLRLNPDINSSFSSNRQIAKERGRLSIESSQHSSRKSRFEDGNAPCEEDKQRASISQIYQWMDNNQASKQADGEEIGIIPIQTVNLKKDIFSDVKPYVWDRPQCISLVGQKLEGEEVKLAWVIRGQIPNGYSEEIVNEVHHKLGLNLRKFIQEESRNLKNISYQKTNFEKKIRPGFTDK